MKPLMRLIAALAVVTPAAPALAAVSGGAQFVDLSSAPPGSYASNGRTNQWTARNIVSRTELAPYQQLASEQSAATRRNMSAACLRG